jgi:hypothetical protein
MANTFELISAVTVGAGGATTVTFSSIPSTYTDLVLKMSVRSSHTGGVELWINPNGSSANGTAKALQGNGAAAASYNSSRFETFGYVNWSTTTANTFSSVDSYIPNYAGSSNKSMSSDGVSEDNSTTAYAMLEAALWSNTAAITSLDIVLATGKTFVQYSSFYLYGVKNA